MRILGKTPDQFIPIYLQECRPEISLSETTIYTISNILQTFVMLGTGKTDKKITIKQLASKAGYSRTTVYTYFEDVNDIQKCIEEMLFLHTQKNAALYYQCLLDRLSEAEDQEVIETVSSFRPYIYAIHNIDPAFAERYQNYILKSFYNVAQGGGIRKEIRPLLTTAVASSLATIILEEPSSPGDQSTAYGLNAAKIIMKSVFEYGQRLKKEGTS